MSDVAAVGTEVSRRPGKGSHPNSRAVLARYKHPNWPPGQSGNPRQRRVDPSAPDALQRMVERLAKPVPAGSCVCGCRHAINPAYAVVVPSIGTAVNLQHATQALANWMQRAREELAKLGAAP